jgi:hypothetical protein
MGFHNPWDSLAHGACLLGTKPATKPMAQPKPSKKK